MVFSSSDGLPHLRWSSLEWISVVCQQLVALLTPTRHLGAWLHQSGSTLCVQFLLQWVTTLWLGAGLHRRMSTVCGPVDTTRQIALGVTPFCAVFPTVLPAFFPSCPLHWAFLLLVGTSSGRHLHWLRSCVYSLLPCCRRLGLIRGWGVTTLLLPLPAVPYFTSLRCPTMLVCPSGGLHITMLGNVMSPLLDDQLIATLFLGLGGSGFLLSSLQPTRC